MWFESEKESRVLGPEHLRATKRWREASERLTYKEMVSESTKTQTTTVTMLIGWWLQALFD